MKSYLRRHSAALCVIAGIIGSLIVLMMLSACNQQQPVYAQVAQPAYVAPAQVVAAPPAVIVQNSGGDLATGMMLGHMLSGGSRTTIVHHTTVISRPVYSRSYYSSRSYYRRR